MTLGKKDRTHPTVSLRKELFAFILDRSMQWISIFSAFKIIRNLCFWGRSWKNIWTHCAWLQILLLPTSGKKPQQTRHFIKCFSSIRTCLRFVETYGITVPPKQRYLLKKTVINIAPNKQLSVRKSLQLYLPCLSRLDLPWSTVYHTDSQWLNISAKYYSVIMVCLKLTL